ncbi:MAG: flagellar hook-basal body complex protein [Caenispirillum bisanense]|nr:flagellar hook-basal body complex protein [Caenispirillum bisanense]MCA1972268.1 flagellar hook-basal body complex protein [Caenispirillum sp.]
MSVYGAMNAAVSGMRAQSKSLGNISDNIANSQTTGYKRVDTSFAELVTLSNRSTHAPGGVIATPRYRHNTQGDVSQTQITTNMAISGNGFFVVSKANSITPASVSFDSEEIYSRRGDFQLDKFGYLRNGAGYFLNGRRVLNEETLATSDINAPIRIETDVMEANQTSRINYNANLPANAGAFPSSAVATTGTLDPQDLTVDFTTAAAAAWLPASTASITINGTAYTSVAPATSLNAALDNLAQQIRSDYPNLVVRTPNNGGPANSFVIEGTQASPSFTYTAASATTTVGAADGETNNAATQTVSFAGTINQGDVISMTVGGVTQTLTYDVATHTNLDGFIDAFADLFDPAGTTVLGPTDVGGAAGQLILVGGQSINRPAVVAGGRQYALNLANSDETSLYSANGSYSGGAVTVYNDLGVPTDIQMRWVNTGAENSWTLLARDPNGGDTPWVDLGEFAFQDGRPISVDGNAFVGTLDITAGTIAGIDDVVTLDFTGIDNDPNDGQPNILLTQFYADDIAVYRLDQDGYQPGILTDVFINDFGYVVANYDNGRSRTLFQVPIATFSSPNDLARMDGGAFKRTPESGDPLVAEAGQAGAGDIVASAIEQSNVDIADEFTKMIVTQRAYSANSKTVRTADEMLEEVVNLKR